MPAPIIGGLRTFLQANTGATWWDGEVPRYDLNGNPIFPATPSVAKGQSTPWPIFRVVMTEAGFDRNWTFEWAYDDEGDIHIEVYGTTRAQEENVLDEVEALLALEANWPLIEVSGLPENPNYVIAMIFKNWSSIHEENVRGPRSELIYAGRITYQCRIHGAVITRGI